LNKFEMKCSKNGGIYSGINATCFKRGWLRGKSRGGGGEGRRRWW
jgi:hypothetical protein